MLRASVSVSSLLLLLAVTVAQSAFGQTTPQPTPPPSTPPSAPPFVSKDWSLDLATCVATTTAATKLASYKLEVALDVSKARPVEIRVRPALDLVPATLGMRFALDRKTAYAFSALTLEDGSTVFWNLPRGSKDLLSYLKRENKIKVDLLDGTPVAQQVAFSLRGSSATLSEMQKRCNSNQDFVADGFERAFLPAVVANVDPTKVPASESARLRDLVKTAFAAFKTSGTAQAQLNALSQQYLTSIAEYEKLRSNLDKLTQGTVAKLTARRTESQGKIDQANIDIPAAKKMVGEQEAVLAQANAAQDAANNDIAPLLPEYKRLRGLVSNAESDVSSADSALSSANTYESQTRSRLQDIINGIARSKSDISSIESAIWSTKNDLSSAQSTAESRRREYSNAQSDRQRFNRDSEFRDRLSRDSRYSSIDSDIRSNRSRADSARSRVSSLQSDRSRIEDAISHCKTDPAADCSRQENQLRDTDNLINQANNEVRDAESRCSSLENDKDRIEREISRDVDSKDNELRRCESDAQNRYNDAQSVANDLENRLRRYTNSDLPQAQSALNSWESARPTAENDVNTAVNMVSRAERDVRSANNDLDAAQSRLSSWKQSSGYNAKKKVVDQADTKVAETKSTLKRLDENIAKSERVIRDETKNLADVEAQMQVALETIRQKEARSTEVQKLLAPYFAQRDQFMITKQEADQTFRKAQTDFASSLPQFTAAALATFQAMF